MTEDPYRAEMLAWADQMERENASLGPLLALEVRNRVAKIDRVIEGENQ